MNTGHYTNLVKRFRSANLCRKKGDVFTHSSSIYTNVTVLTMSTIGAHLRKKSPRASFTEP